MYQHLRPHVRKNGDLLYRVQDGGLVADEADQVRVEQVSMGAAFLALSLAEERFQGQALVVEGDDDFKRQLIQLANTQGFQISFADPEMEKKRLESASKTSKALSQTPGEQRNSLTQGQEAAQEFTIS